MKTIAAWVGRNREKVWFAACVNLLMLAFCLIVMRPEFDSNDDFNIAMFVNRARPIQDPYWLYCNWILGNVCAFAYRITNMVPWYGLMQYFGLFAAFTGAFWVIQKIFRGGAALVLSMTLLNFFAAESYVNIQFTRTAGVCAACGLFLVVYAITREKIRILPLLSGIAVTAYGYMYRHLEADLIFALFGVFGVYLLLRLKEDAPKQMLQRAARYLLLFGLTIGICFGFRLIDRYAYSRSSESSAYEAINDARATLTDYGFPKYEEHAELFESLGITYSAYKLFSKWNFYDPDVFTLEKMNALIAVQKRRGASLETLKEYFGIYPYKWFENPMFYCFLVMLVIALIHGRRGWKRAAEIALLLLALTGLYYYMYLQGRFNLPRVDDPVWLAGCLILVYLVSPERFVLPVRYAWTMVLILFVVNQGRWSVFWRHNTVQDEEKRAKAANFIAQVASDQEHLYLTKAGLYAISPGYGPLSLVPIGVASNMGVLGGWPAGSPAYQAALAQYGVTNPYRDCINNEKVYLIDNDINLTLNYIREYYDMKAQAVEAGSFDKKNTMYQIVSE
ncbi:MAG TPA: hypothetical protein DHV42_06645 [Lachnospiraceae bacterium]|nr:hypothetical protein [Lachnospiraceae bacterium]